MKLLGLFPGQGSQKVGMGKGLWASSSIAKDLFERADKVLGFSLSDICFNGPAESLNETQNAQPAILTLSTICYELFKQSGKANLSLAAGHSLGEFSALVAASALRFEDAVALVHRRGKYMQAAVPLGTGKMIAVLGKTREELEAVCKSVTAGIVEVANINAPGQIVLAGEKSAVDAAVLAMPGAKVIELPVSVPSHTSLMKTAADSFASDLADIEISACAFPVLANVNASVVNEPGEIRNALTRQLTSPVLWVDSIENAVNNLGVTHAVEIGFGQVLSGLLKRINPALPKFAIDSQEAVEKFSIG